MADGHLGRCLGVSDPEPGQVALHRCVQLDLTGLDQLHDRQGSERLGERADEEGRLRRRRHAAGASLSKAAQVHDLLAGDNGERCAGDIEAAHLLLYISIDRLIRGAI